jgi:hypothetical protein
MVSQAKREDIEKRIEICKQHADLWEEFFQFFGTGNFQERKILDQDESRFDKVMTELAKSHFRFCFFMGEKFGDGERVLDVLERAEGLRAIQAMPDANFGKLEIDWHTVFISMHRAVGRLMLELPPEEPEVEEGKGKKKKGKAKRVPKKAAKRAKAPAPRSAAPAPKLGAPGSPKLGVPKMPPGPPRPKGP